MHRLELENKTSSTLCRCRSSPPIGRRDPANAFVSPLALLSNSQSIHFFFTGTCLPCRLPHMNLPYSIFCPQVVLADGKVLDLLSTNRKDNTGYALKHLFIGAEGTLGVVTRCSLAVPPRPASVSVALLVLSEFEGVERVLSLARGRLGEVLSAVEFMDKETVALTLEKCQEVRSPFRSPSESGGGGGGDNGGHEYYVLVETSGSDAAHDAEKLDGFLEAAMELVSRVEWSIVEFVVGPLN